MLADFIMEYTIPDDGSILKNYENSNNNSCLVLHMDRASNSQKSSTNLILTSFEGFNTEQVLRFNFNTSNNDAKYKAIIVGLKMVKELGVRKLKIFIDS